MKPLRPFRSMLSVLVGYLLMSFLVGLSHLGLAALAPDAFHQAEARIDPPWLQILWVLGGLAATLGGWTTARLAPRAALAHALVLAGVVFGAWVLYASFVPAEQSPWSPPVILLLGLVGVFVGGVLRQLQLARHSGRS